MRRLLIILYTVVVAAMAAATVVEKYQGTDFVHRHFYGSWWFVALWAALTIVAVSWFLRRKIRRLPVIALHLSFILILLGALLTHLTSRQGRIHLRTGESVRYNGYTLRLESFNIDYHSGTATAADYRSVFTLTDGDKEVRGEVSMNNIFSYHSLRLYQSSYDDDLCGSILMANTDPWGISVTYAGYALLLVSLLLTLLSPRGSWRRALRSLSAACVTLLMLCSFTSCANPSAENTSPPSNPPTLPRDVAGRFDSLLILHNGRICPFETFAIEFTRKVSGGSSYQGLTAGQVALGWLFYSDQWSRQPFIEVKSREVRHRLQMPRRRSLNDFFVREMGGYTIGPYVQEYYSGHNDTFHRGIADIDEKIRILMALSRGASLKVFPHTFDSDYSRTHTDAAIRAGEIRWYAPTDALHHSIEEDEAAFIHGVFALIYEAVHNGDYDTVTQLVDKLAAYQQSRGGSSLPTASQLTAEHINNSIPITTILFIVNLIIGIAAAIHQGLRGAKGIKLHPYIAVCILSFLSLSFLLMLRYVISGSLPLSNGYETTLVVAWVAQAVTIPMARRLPVMLIFGCLLTGFALLVSHLGIMNPAIGHLMPILNSPLLSIHVSIIMVAYALLSITFLCSLMALIGNHIIHRSPNLSSNLQLISLLLLAPAVVTLAIGIFVGAVWANVSWGVYWSWDPKEVWALITLMVYAVPLHSSSLPAFSRPRVYHVYMLCAFATVLMTYFGVNYLLGGMHSYA